MVSCVPIATFRFAPCRPARRKLGPSASQSGTEPERHRAAVRLALALGFACVTDLLLASAFLHSLRPDLASLGPHPKSSRYPLADADADDHHRAPIASGKSTPPYVSPSALSAHSLAQTRGPSSKSETSNERRWALGASRRIYRSCPMTEPTIDRYYLTGSSRASTIVGSQRDETRRRDTRRATPARRHTSLCSRAITPTCPLRTSLFSRRTSRRLRLLRGVR